MAIPKWLKCQLNEKELQDVSACVGEAESHTRGEIVPMVVRSSSTVDHVPMILFLMVFAGLLVVNDGLQGLYPHSWTWAVIGSAVVSALFLPLARHSRLQFWLTSKADRHHHVVHRAQLEFYEAGISHTTGNTGVLLFVSMMERQAVVLADKTIADKLPPETWNQVIAHLLTGMASGRLADGLKAAILAIGKILSEHFPQQQHDNNELPNQLVIKD